MIVDDEPYDDVLMAAEGAVDADTIAFTNDAVRFGGLTVDCHLAGLTGALGFRAGLEEARHVEPDVERTASVTTAQMKTSTLPLL